MTEQARIAVIRIKGKPGMKKEIRDTFEKLRLYKKNTCTIIPNTPSYVGMLDKIKHAATWGEVDEATCFALFTKRAKIHGNKKLTDEYIKEKLKTDMKTFTHDFMIFKKELKEVPGLKNFFKLQPPRSGFERKGIKVPFSQGGVVGYRKEKINELLTRMI